MHNTVSEYYNTLIIIIIVTFVIFSIPTVTIQSKVITVPHLVPWHTFSLACTCLPSLSSLSSAHAKLGGVCKRLS